MIVAVSTIFQKTMVLKRYYAYAITVKIFSVVEMDSEDEDIALASFILVVDEKRTRKENTVFRFVTFIKKEKNKEFIVISSESYNMMIGNTFSG